MTFLALLQQVRAQPYRYLGETCPEQLSIFLSGYFGIDNGKDAIHEHVSRAVTGNREFMAETRMYLAEPDPVRGLDRMLELYEEALAIHPDTVLPMLPASETPVVEIMRHAIASGRAPMAIGEPTVLALFSFVNGCLAALDVVNPALAGSQRAAFVTFEGWMRNRYGYEHASWHVILRVCNGVDERGVKTFLERWDECFRTGSR